MSIVARVDLPFFADARVTLLIRSLALVESLAVLKKIEAQMAVIALH